MGIKDDLGLSTEQFGKLRLFNRILISYNDLKQTHEIASLLLGGDFYKDYPTNNRHLVIALNMAAIVSYSRPFLDSKGELAHNRLPAKVLKQLNAKEMEVHHIVLNDRHTMMAHSDPDANISIPLVIEITGQSILYPKNSAPYAIPLLPETMQLLSEMALKLRDYCFTLRQEMEPELIQFLPRAQLSEADAT
jgi:hypothetical protein